LLFLKLPPGPLGGSFCLQGFLSAGLNHATFEMGRWVRVSRGELARSTAVSPRQLREHAFWGGFPMRLSWTANALSIDGHWIWRDAAHVF
jgi:hypothetical protein